MNQQLFIIDDVIDSIISLQLSIMVLESPTASNTW